MIPIYAKAALAIWLIPVVLFAVLALVHKRLFFPRIRDWIATLGMGVGLALSVWLLFKAFSGEDLPAQGRFSFEWIKEGMAVGVMVDNLTAVMLVVVTLVSFLVHLFSIGYMHGDSHYGRYFCCLLLFSASMLGLVLADNFLLLYVFWELVGLSSYLLIGHFFWKKSASDAANKAFITTRIGDVGMFLGILIIYWQVGSFRFEDVFAAAAAGELAGNWRLLAGLGIFFGAVGKSAQFPLHVWLPDAMEGPTPVSALIHAATMVAAGVYLVGRVFPLFDDQTLLVIAYTGAITAFMAATIALVQDDIKKVLAYSTVSQLGYMMLALGVGSWVGGLFHLTTHACFKAGLFLGSGSVIHAMHHEQSMSQYGGLHRKMKITSITFLLCCMAISGVPWITAGFYSKDLILGDSLAFAMKRGHWLLPLLGFVTAFMTAFYMFRQYFLTFTGEPRNHEKFHHAHESPKTMTIPLIVLAALAIVAGGFKLSPHTPTWFEKVNTVPTLAAYAPAAENAALERAAAEAHGEAAAAGGEHGAEAAEGEHGGGHHDPVVMRAHTLGMILSILLAGGGIALAFAFYFRGLTHVPALLKARLKPIHSFLWNKWYFDELYMATLFRGSHLAAKASWLFDRFVVDFVVNLAGWSGRLAAWLIGLVDKYVVDGTVNGLGWICQGLGAGFAQLQSGQLRSYLLTLIVGFMVVAATLAAILLGAV